MSESALAPRVTIVDYGIGNLLSVARACTQVGAEVEVTTEAEAVAAAERLVVPGVGAFADCMEALRRRDLEAPIRAFVESGRPMLGICVGMQMLLSASEEFGETTGLDVIPGRVRAIPATGADGSRHKIPHIGWNELEAPLDRGAGWWAGTPLAGLAERTPVYFVHSFAAEPDDPADRLAECDYDGRRISAAVRRGNVTGTQFHPEKSGPAGLAILMAFLGK